MVKREFKWWWSTIPAISIKQTNTTSDVGDPGPILGQALKVYTPVTVREVGDGQDFLHCIDGVIFSMVVLLV